MTTDTKGPPPGTAAGDSAQPDPNRPRLVSRRTAVVVGALGALLIGVVSGAAATSLESGRADETAGRAGALTVRVESLTAQVESLTADVDRVTARVDGLAAEKAELADTVAEAQARAESLAEANAALRERLADIITGSTPVAAEVGFGGVSRASSCCRGRTFLLVVNVTVTNPDTAEEAYFSKGDVLLKGPDGTRFPPLEQSPVSSDVQRAQLPSLMLAPSERVKGSLVFYVSQAVTEFTVSYQGTSTALSL
jgi:hypothetical protein